MHISQSNGFLHDLTSEVLNGHAVPAAFQRPYRWVADDVEKLWSSILRGFPVGAFLMWKPTPDDLPELSARNRIGPRPFTPGNYPTVILDGQNRLGTFAWSSWIPGEPLPDGAEFSEEERATWLSGMSLVADADERRVHFVPQREASEGQRMAAGLLMDIKRLWPEIRRRDKEGRPLTDEAMTWLVDRGAEMVMRTRFTQTVIHDATPEEAREAFLHMSRLGVPMSDEDLDQALGWTPPQGPRLG